MSEETADIWVLNASSESGDNYFGVRAWKHEPTKEEVYGAIVESFCQDYGEVWEIGEENSDEGTNPFELNGQEYGSFLYFGVHPTTLHP
jgi:hypothetical protein